MVARLILFEAGKEWSIFWFTVLLRGHTKAENAELNKKLKKSLKCWLTLKPVVKFTRTLFFVETVDQTCVCQ